MNLLYLLIMYFLLSFLKYIENIEVYKEFAILNEGFVNTKKNTDLKLPNSLKTPSKEELYTIHTTIQEVVKTGNFDKLFEIRGLIL